MGHVISVNKGDNVEYFEKPLLAPTWDIFTPNWAQNHLYLPLGIHFKEFCTVIGHYEKTKAKIFLGQYWLFLYRIEPKFSYTLSLESTLMIILNFCMMIRHYK